MAFAAAGTNVVARPGSTFVAALLSRIALGAGHRHGYCAGHKPAPRPPYRIRTRPEIVVGAMLALSSHTGALAQSNNATANNTSSNAEASPTQISAPKQVGPWTVAGWNHTDGSYCTV